MSDHRLSAQTVAEKDLINHYSTPHLKANTYQDLKTALCLNTDSRLKLLLLYGKLKQARNLGRQIISGVKKHITIVFLPTIWVNEIVISCFHQLVLYLSTRISRCFITHNSKSPQPPQQVLRKASIPRCKINYRITEGLSISKDFYLVARN